MNSALLWLLRLFPQFRKLEQREAKHCKELGAVRIERLSDLARSESNYQRVLEGNARLEAEQFDLKNQLASAESDLDSLRNANDELTTEKLLLQDRLDSALNDKDRLWDTMQQALNGERSALKTMVNHSVQKSGGGIPFPEEHSLPANTIRPVQQPGPVGRSGRLLPSEAMGRANNSFIENYFKTPEDQSSH